MSEKIILLEGGSGKKEIYIHADAEFTYHPAELDRESGRYSSQESVDFEEVERYYFSIGNDKEGFKEFEIDPKLLPPEILEEFESIAAEGE
jgi:hypothetical protein